MYPILLSIGQVNVYTHGLMIALGIFLGGIVLYLLSKKYQLSSGLVFDVVIYSVIVGILGARILYIVLYPEQFNNIVEMISIWYGGLVSFGGIIAGFLTAFFLLKSKNEFVARWFDLGIIGFLIGWAIGRLGCLLNGDSVGIVSSSVVAIWGRIPVQLMESIWSLIVAGTCYWFLVKKDVFQLKNGMIFWTGLGGYLLGRFVIDFYREENLLFLSLKPGQIVSLVGVLLAFFLVLFMIKEKKGQPNANN